MNIANVVKNPRYLVDRTRYSWFYRTHPEQPWLTSESIDLLAVMLKKTDTGLEWGAGRSTAWFSRRVQRLVSVEHSREWFERVQGMLAGMANVDLRLQEDTESYVGVTDQFAPESFDFILVDGEMARDECAHRAIPLLRPGGILILDDAHRYIPNDSRAPLSRRAGDCSRFDAGSWDRFLDRVETWRHIWTTNGCTCTAMWIKP